MIAGELYCPADETLLSVRALVSLLPIQHFTLRQQILADDWTAQYMPLAERSPDWRL